MRVSQEKGNDLELEFLFWRIKSNDFAAINASIKGALFRKQNIK